MSDSYIQYVRYATQTYRTFEDLENPHFRKAHNDAMMELHNLEVNELFVTADKDATLVSKLLKHEDERVRMSAAAYCLKARILRIRAYFILFRLSRSRTVSGYIRAEAAQCIKYCKPYGSKISREGQ